MGAESPICHLRRDLSSPVAHSEPETGSDGVRSGSDRGAVRRGQVSIGRPATKSTNDAHPVDGYLGNVTSKMGTGSANPFRLRTPFDSNPINFPAHRSRTALETAMPPVEATPHSRAESCTDVPNKSPSSVTGSPTLIPIRR